MKKLGKKHIIIFACITALILAVSIVSFKTGNNAVSNIIGTVISPVQSGCAAVVRGTKNFAVNIFSSGKNARENEKLKAEIASLNDQLRMVEGYKTENEKLRSMLQLAESRSDFESTAANVIGRSIDELHSTITIDKGTRHNIKKNAVVYTAEGLVGRVSEVGYNFSKVQTIFDAESAVSAICLRSGDMGIVEGSSLSTGGICTMNYIDKSAKTVVGDMVETSAAGGIFPQGILIGKITQIKEDNRALTLSAVVETSVNPNNLDKVLVITDVIAK
ncbi:MAG: rod shape-determining protein MreC [Clostridia bacterium]|nr:rod shape-determining protein MreC [Clostridia bacterium]